MKVNEKLKQYSAMCISVLATQFSAKAEAVYTDIDPDLILDSDLDFAYIDLDNNGASDFVFFNFSYYFATSSLALYFLLQRLGAFPSNSNNGIIGTFEEFEYGAIFYPLALPTNSFINSTHNFQNDNFQILAFRSFLLNSTGMDLFDFGGNWYPEIIDHYLGVKFLDAENCLHYGWIRCDVDDNGRTLRIKDYAYEKKCNTGILAGDTIGDTTTVSNVDINLINANIYAFNSNVYVQLDENPGNYSIRITNLSGALIYSDILRDKWNVISLIKEPEGLYFIEIFAGQKKLVVKKIFIN